MAKRLYEIIFERNELGEVSFSYSELVDGKRSTEPTDEIGRIVFRDYVNRIAVMDEATIFKNPDEKRLEIKIEVD